MLQIIIADNGRGIKFEDQNKLFKLYGNAREDPINLNLQGIGFGLVISKFIVNKFGGFIDYIS